MTFATNEIVYLNRYPHTKRQCIVCTKFFSWRFRGRKRIDKTCSRDCAIEYKKYPARYNPQNLEYQRNYQRGRRERVKNERSRKLEEFNNLDWIEKRNLKTAVIKKIRNRLKLLPQQTLEDIFKKIQREFKKNGI